LTAGLLFIGAQSFKHREIFERSGVTGDCVSRGDLAQKSPHDFSRARFGQGIGETYVVGTG